jgi:hypothetical protein
MAILDDILRLFGTSRVRLRWRWEQWKTTAAQKRNSAANRARVVTYAHKSCPRCGHPADRDARQCAQCGATLSSYRLAKLG